MLERLIDDGRHIEIQVFADAYGNAVYLGERDCTAQRRRQKVIEEAPSPVVTPALREAMGKDAVAAALAVGYRGAGTVEFMVDQDLKHYFLEMNTRLQVEHPVTEAITGLDLVELQLRVAANERLPIAQHDVQPCGHAIEARINAEDPANDFRPSPGRVTKLVLPEGEGIRVDTHLREGDRIPPVYDSMIAKVIVCAPTRPEAIALMDKALGQMKVEGVTTNLELQRRILGWETFQSGRYDTTSLERWLRGSET
jgi:acetyl/propionyl-CoA carboxylase alpha subunit